jgi:MFS family permease
MNEQAASAAVVSGSARARSLACVIAAIALATLNYGLTFPLLALILERQGIDHSLIGLNTAAQALAVAVAAPITSRLMTALGPRRLLLSSMGLSAAIYLTLPAWPSLWPWFPLRFLLGCCGSLIWVASEAWINAMAESRNRGRIVGIYATASSTGMALGPLLLLVTGTSGWAPFIVAALLSGLGCVAALLAGGAVPQLEGRPSRGFLQFLWLAPLPFLLNLVFAATSEAFHTFFAIFALDHRIAEQRAFLLMTVMSFGGIVLQYPMGWLADHMNRWLLLLFCIAATIAGFMAAPAAISYEILGLPVFFLFGGCFAMLYSFGVILLGERFTGADLAAASAVFTLMWGTGTLAGPVVTGAVMDWIGPVGLIATTVGFLLLYAPIPAFAWAKTRRKV